MSKEEAIKKFEEKHQCEWEEIEEERFNMIYLNSNFSAMIKYSLKPEDPDFIDYSGSLGVLKEIFNIVEKYYL